MVKVYLNEIRQRKKWREPTPFLEVGTLVLMKEDNYLCSQWPLGRIEGVALRQDG